MIEGEKRLSCGHFLTFVKKTAAQSPNALPHVKTESMLAAYNDLLNVHYRGFRPRRILEVGVERGGSLALWHEAFKCPVVGIDRDLSQVCPAASRHCAERPDMIAMACMTMPDPRASSLGTFDFIVDDGGHGAALVVSTLGILWGQLLPGGLYVIEDWRLQRQDPGSLLAALSRRIVENEELEYASIEAPAKVTIYRSLIAMEKKASPPPHMNRDETV